MCQQVAGAGALPAVVARLIWTDRRAGDLADDGGEDHIALKWHAAALQRCAGDHEGGDPALHVGDAQAAHLAIQDGAAQLRLRLHARGDHPVLFGAGVARIHMAVEHQAQAAAGALEDTDGVRPAGLHHAADRLHAVRREPVEDKLGELLLATGGAGNVRERAAQLTELVAVDLRQNALSQRLVYRHLRAPHTSLGLDQLPFA